MIDSRDTHSLEVAKGSMALVEYSQMVQKIAVEAGFLPLVVQR